MTLAGVVLIVALILVVVDGLVVAWLWQDRNTLKKDVAYERQNANEWKSLAERQTKQLQAVHAVEEKRNEQKNAVAAGGFDASVAVLSDLAGTPRTGKTTDPRSVARVP